MNTNKNNNNLHNNFEDDLYIKEIEKRINKVEDLPYDRCDEIINFLNSIKVYI